MKRLLLLLILLWGGGVAGYWYWNDARATPVAYRTESVRRGDLHLTIEANGTVEPVEVVDVGAQVTGQVESFGTDPGDPEQVISYRSQVKEGTVLARLDDALFKARVEQARAQLDRAKADLQQAEAKVRQTRRALDRATQLHSRGGGLVSAEEYDTAQADYETAQAGVAIARSAVAVSDANLQEAEVNLGNATIRSPVDGVVVDRRVNLGQTVGSGVSSSNLFLIAKDLSLLEIWASVNEADIGAIHPGQTARFSVASLPEKSFVGQVSQVRLNASMVHNVVTYTVVIDVDNSEGEILPYLTARVRFEVDERSDVLLVPNAALRFRPPRKSIAASSPRSGLGEREDRQAQGTLWVRSGERLRGLSVRLGATDGLFTEVEGEGIHEGLEVVVGQQTSQDAGSTSPFLPQFDEKKKKDEPKR